MLLYRFVYYGIVLSAMQNLLTIQEASQFLHVHPNTLKRWDKSGELKSIRFGIRGDRKYRASDLEKFIAKSDQISTKVTSGRQQNVTLAIIVTRENKILLGKRLNGDHKGFFSFISGELTSGKTFEQSAIDNIKNKVSIEIMMPRVFCITNNSDAIHEQHLTIGLVAEFKEGDLQKDTSEEYTDIDWYPLEHLPSPLFEMDSKVLRCYKTGRFYID